MSFIARQRGRKVLEQQHRFSVQAFGRGADIGGDELEELVENIAYGKGSDGEAFDPSPSRGRP